MKTTTTPPETAGSESHTTVFRRAAHRSAVTGLVTVLLGVGAGLLAGGPRAVGAVWGAGAGVLITAMTVAALLVPWDRFPLLASSGVMISFVGKILVMVAVVILAGPHKDQMAPMWFLVCLAVVLLSVTAVEVQTLAAGRALTVASTDEKR